MRLIKCNTHTDVNNLGLTLVFTKGLNRKVMCHLHSLMMLIKIMNTHFSLERMGSGWPSSSLLGNLKMTGLSLILGVSAVAVPAEGLSSVSTEGLNRGK